MRIVVNTPAGNIGRVVADQLLRATEETVIITRSPQKVADLVKRGARVVAGSIDDVPVLDRAMRGADALFWLTPFAFDQPDYLNWARSTGRAAAVVAKEHGLKRIVLISSVGAQEESGVGPIGCLPAIEAAFRAAAPNVVSLRAGSFMENYLLHVDTIALAGTIFGAYPATKRIPIVATRDIAEKAVEFLRDARWGGFRLVGVHGPQDLDQTQAAALIGQGIARPVKYVQVNEEQARTGMQKAGLPPYAVDLLCEMYAGFNAGRTAPAEPRTAETTTRTSLLEFSRDVLKPAVQAAAVARGPRDVAHFSESRAPRA